MSFRCIFGHSIIEPRELMKYANWKKWALDQALNATQGSSREAAKLIGVGKTTINRWLKENKNGNHSH